MRKLDKHTLEVTKSTDDGPKILYYDRQFLEDQREQIQKQWDADNKQRQKEIAEVDSLLHECDKLGIVVAPKSDDVVGMEQ